MNVITILTLLIQTILCEYDRRVITTLKYSKYTVIPTIVNGKPAHEGEIPYLVSLKEPVQKIEPGKSVWNNLCGGSIIDNLRVLTAAHCFETNQFYYAKYPGILRLVAGDIRSNVIHSGDTETTEKSQWRRINRVILHQYFSFPSNDIALAMVDVPWNFTNWITPINIAKRGMDYKHECISAGYGRLGHSLKDTISPVLLTAQIVPMPRWRCSLVWEMNMNSFICTESAITDVARGDSGGPLTCQGTSDPNEDNKLGVLVGVVSGKNYDKTTLYTRVSEYHDWIANDGVAKLDVDLCLAIILLILIYLLFHWLIYVCCIFCYSSNQIN